MRSVENSNVTARNFIPGQEWLYYKLYCGTSSSDRILAGAIYPVSCELRRRGVVDKWFFIRYADPEDHLRVRFHISDHQRLNEIIQLIEKSCEAYYSAGLIWRIQIDSYSRELERYDAPGIENSEELFYLNSELSLKLITQLNELDDLTDYRIRWLFALKWIDSLLRSFGMELASKKEFSQNLADGFGQEFGMNTDLRKALGEMFRKERASITSALSDDRADAHFRDFLQLANSLKESEKVIIDKILLQSEKHGTPSLLDSISSFIHMFVNRVFKKNQRRIEMELHHMLFFHYRSEIAQKVGSAKVTIDAQ